MEVVLRDHDRSIVVATWHARAGYGPVIVDGAFTKLYCHWDTGGSARFVKNCACWLSTIVPTDGTVAELAEPADATPVVTNKLVLTDAFNAECTITFEEGPVALLAAELADPEQNTTDLVLDNNLSAGKKNMVFGGGELVQLETAKLFLEQVQIGCRFFFLIFVCTRMKWKYNYSFLFLRCLLCVLRVKIRSRDYRLQRYCRSSRCPTRRILKS